ncbi:peptide/nickel transport system substrate-binding protein [Streptomyces aurantiacus]|uniref:ABC transporter substrate-binding protein n=1 Tax=Streptomyces aurantiacus TaxID=47760 RepID=UPI002791C2C3|nr:ABC transporter substrate-binding protein [Streptomyces aurantiacus]MDQ0771917.1 peptide/nickel transport system substrate-binding protein [Streptomyces aurantiacus]
MRYAGTTTLAMAGALALALTACSGGGGTSGSGKPVDGGTFTLAIAADPGTLDPHATTLSVAHQVGLFMYDSLMSRDASGKEVPALAGTWKSTPTTASYTLRKGITCSDGTPLTAKDVADNINYASDPKKGSSMVGLYVPAGAKAKADDAARTVTVTSPSADAFLGRNVGSLPIVCRKGLDDRSILKQGGSGTGLFTLTQAVADDHYTFTRRKDHTWGPGNQKAGSAKGLPDSVVLKVVRNEATSANLLLSKQINAALITGQDKTRVQDRLDFKRTMHAPLGELWFNQRRGAPTADPEVRRALTSILDLAQLRKVITNGAGEPASGLVAKGQGPCAVDTVAGNLPDHDQAAAEAALDAAGWTKGSGGVRQKDGKKLSLTFYYPTSRGAPMQNAAELLRSFWQKAGVKVTLRGAADSQFDQVLAGEGSWDAMFLPLTVTLPTQAVPFISGPTSPGGNNFGSIDNPEYTAHVKAASVLAGAKGCDEWAAAEKALFRRADVVPFADLVTPVFGNGATFDLIDGAVAPTSIRVVG